MIVQINKKEIAALTFHMNIMRPSFRNICKKNYKDKLKEYMNSYDYVKFEATNALELEVEEYVLNLNIVDLNVLRAFLDAYIAKSKAVNEQVKSDDYDEHLELLENVKNKADAVAAA